MDREVQSVLVDSMLDTAWSLQTLEKELDRIATPHREARESEEPKRALKHHKKRKREKVEERTLRSSREIVNSSWLPEAIRLSPIHIPNQADKALKDEGEIWCAETPDLSRPSSQASHFDSAFGSLHSQLDDDSFSTPSPHLPKSVFAKTVTEEDSQEYTNSAASKDTHSSKDRSATIHPLRSTLHPKEPECPHSTAMLLQPVEMEGRTEVAKQLERVQDHLAVPGSRQSTASAKHGTAWQKVAMNADEEDTPKRRLSPGIVRRIKEVRRSPVGRHKTLAERGDDSDKLDDGVGTGEWSTRFYHESITPQASPSPLPRRYHVPIQPHSQDMTDSAAVSPSAQRRSNIPKRSSSILQRLRIRRTSSFQQRRRPRIPVKRSLSDRITYQGKKRWIDHQDELNPISTPSRLRPIGRLMDTRQTSNLHIVELHKPQNGYYGIYIIEGEMGGIFISRFADLEAEKLYCGLLSRGDEIVAINRQPIRSVSLDHVHSVLATLDSVVLTIVPAGYRPKW